MSRDHRDPQQERREREDRCRLQPGGGSCGSRQDRPDVQPRLPSYGLRCPESPTISLPLSRAFIEDEEGFDSPIQPTAVENLSVSPAGRGLNATKTGLGEWPGRKLRLCCCLKRFPARESDYTLVDTLPSLAALSPNAWWPLMKP